MRFSRTNM